MKFNYIQFGNIFLDKRHIVGFSLTDEFDCNFDIIQKNNICTAFLTSGKEVKFKFISKEDAIRFLKHNGVLKTNEIKNYSE